MSQYKLSEVIKQPYADCEFSAGFVEGHPVDTLFLKLDRNDNDDVLILLRPDEMAAILYCASGVLWSLFMQILEEK